MSGGAETAIEGLQVEGLTNPLGLEQARPRLAWRMAAARSGARQSAYRVRVTRSEGAARAGAADLWDSGRIESGRSFDVIYGGPALTSCERVWWTVDVWDETGATTSAEPAWWEMGLLEPGDWSASWLAAETDEERADRQAGLNWIWAETEYPLEPHRFRYRFTTDADAHEAVLFIGARDRLRDVRLDGAPIELPAAARAAFGRQGVQRLTLGPLAAGEHILAAEARVSRGGGRNPPGVGALAAMLKLVLGDGRVERRVSGPDWRDSQDVSEDWAELGFDDRGWTPAEPAKVDPGQPWPPTGAVLMRRAFEARAVARARLYVTALGAYEVFINGTKVGDARLAPESTDFRKRTLYRVFDVTDLVPAGESILAAHVGDGWYASYVAPGGRFAFGPPPRRFLAQLELTFTDGRTSVVGTGPGWKLAPSPVLASEIYDGEIVDARLEPRGWAEPAFDDAGWTTPHAAAPPPGLLTAHVAPPIRVTQVLKPAAVSEPRPGVFVFDFGQNFAGVCRLRAKGRAGDRIELRFAEILKDSGEVDQANLRAAKARDIFVLAGDAAGETFEPRFTYHGFRYVEIEGYPGTPTLEDLDGLVLNSDLPETGRLRVDNPLIERLWLNSLWSQRSNFVGLPTDCPQRDERLGWTGDANVFWDAAAFNMDVYAFTGRFLDDMRDAQTPAGAFSDYAPAARRFGPEPAPGWADAGVVLPWTAWMRSGNASIVERNWDAITSYLGYIADANPDHLWRNNRGLDFGDWLALDAKEPGDPTTPKDLIGTAWWAHCAQLASQMATAIQRRAEAERLAAMRAGIVEAFRAAYVGEDGRIGNGSQTGYILALHFNLLPEAQRAAAVEHLVADIQRRGGVLSTGFLGTPFSLDVLADAGRSDLVYDLLLRTEFPSWGYMVAKGATTIWERWNGDVGDVAMNSFNHYALGAVTGFLFRRVAGIDAGAPGFKTIRINPVLDPRVKRGGGDYCSAVGLISTDWAQGEDGGFRLTATIPANAVAEIHLPARAGQTITLDGAAVEHARRVGETAILDVGSGVHDLAVG